MTNTIGRLARSFAVGSAALALLVVPMTSATAGTRIASAHSGAVVTNSSQVRPNNTADGTPAGAVQWFQAHLGNSGYEDYCELAVENAYGTSGVWPSPTGTARWPPERFTGAIRTHRLARSSTGISATSDTSASPTAGAASIPPALTARSVTRTGCLTSPTTWAGAARRCRGNGNMPPS